VKQNKAPEIRADLASGQTAENAYQLKRQAKTMAVAAQNQADKAGREFILTAKHVVASCPLVASLRIPCGVTPRPTLRRLGSRLQQRKQPTRLPYSKLL
jgi:hypothetical protein